MSEWEMSHAERIAWRKAGRIEGWEHCKWQVVDMDSPSRDILMTGGIPRLLKSGKNKGRRTWRDSKLTTVVVSDSDVEIEKTNYEANIGKCHECMGRGEVFKSWSTTDGTEYRPCKRCDSTGKPPQPKDT